MRMNPPAGLPGSRIPGVEARNESVTRNVALAPRLPTAESNGEKRRAARETLDAATRLNTTAISRLHLENGVTR